MSVVAPARLERKLLRELDRLVEEGLYVSRSDAIRDAVRRLLQSSRVEEPVQRVLEVTARVAASLIAEGLGREVLSVVLFGSVARGSADEESDVDLLVLVRDDSDPYELTHRAVERLYSLMVALGNVITPTVLRVGEFKSLLEGGFSFASEVLASGKELEGGVLSGFRGESSPAESP